MSKMGLRNIVGRIGGCEDRSPERWRDRKSVRGRHRGRHDGSEATQQGQGLLPCRTQARACSSAPAPPIDHSTSFILRPNPPGSPARGLRGACGRTNPARVHTQGHGKRQGGRRKKSPLFFHPVLHLCLLSHRPSPPPSDSVVLECLAVLPFGVSRRAWLSERVPVLRAIATRKTYDLPAMMITCPI
jgi:hypothetical protein